jgi:adenylate kinase
MTAQYIKFDKVIVLFRGFGKTTVISFVDKGTKKQLEIPNDQLIVNQY